MLHFTRAVNYLRADTQSCFHTHFQCDCQALLHNVYRINRSVCYLALHQWCKPVSMCISRKAPIYIRVWNCYHIVTQKHFVMNIHGFKSLHFSLNNHIPLFSSFPSLFWYYWLIGVDFLIWGSSRLLPLSFVFRFHKKLWTFSINMQAGKIMKKDTMYIINNNSTWALWHLV